MRLGFMLGFLLGGGIASLMAKMQEDTPQGAGAAPGNPVVGAIKRQMNAARDASREAKLEKEAEMQKLYDSMVHRKAAPRD